MDQEKTMKKENRWGDGQKKEEKKHLNRIHGPPRTATRIS